MWVMQNDLEEFFSMVNFTNPGVLGDASYFRRYYEVSMEINADLPVLLNYDLPQLSHLQSVPIFLSLFTARYD
jgi:SNF2 family DNA or RNA helicase